jgi:beta-glucosidase/6-phospho-beta-glucosidase/beta-galactosidase
VTTGNGIPFVGGFESTYQPALDVDITETTGHAVRWREDLELLRASGVDRVRYPVRWHRIEAEPATFDWAATDEVLGHMRDTGMQPIVDLLHHTSYPRWLRRGFADRHFAAAFLRYVEEFALRYPWIEAYTLCNEPFTTFLLCGQEGVWPPHLRGLKGFLTLARNVLPAVAEASRLYRELLPAARHVYVEACEGHSAATPEAEPHAAFANDRRFLLTDLFVGRPVDRDRPFVAAVLAAGGGALLDFEPGHVDVLGLDYYAHNQWLYLDGTGRGVMTSPQPGTLSGLIGEYWARYGLPCSLTETNIRGYGSDRASWLKYTLEQCETAREAGVPMEGYCWFPTIDSCDWDSLLTRSSGSVDPVGVYWLDEHLDRRPSSMSSAYVRAAAGAPAADLPAYRFQPPVAGWLKGWLPQMSHWEWQDPPPSEIVANAPEYGSEIELKVRDVGP